MNCNNPIGHKYCYVRPTEKNIPDMFYLGRISGLLPDILPVKIKAEF